MSVKRAIVLLLVVLAAMLLASGATAGWTWDGPAAHVAGPSDGNG